MEIRLNEEEIILQAEQTSAYVEAASQDDGPSAETAMTAVPTAATKSDRGLLRRFFSEGLAEICTRLKDVVVGVVREGGRILFEVALSKISRRLDAPSVCAQIGGYLIDRILSLWFSTVDSEKAAAWKESADKRLESLREMLAPGIMKARRRPSNL